LGNKIYFCVNISFKSKKLKKNLTDPGEIKKAYGSMGKRLSQRMDQLQAAPNLATLQSFPALNCHLLTGDRKGEWAVSLSGNYRLIFEIAHHPVPLKPDGSIDSIRVTDICIIETIDYH
jgi:plasmid maintenance system killer protein